MIKSYITGRFYDLTGLSNEVTKLMNKLDAAGCSIISTNIDKDSNLNLRCVIFYKVPEKVNFTLR